MKNMITILAVIMLSTSVFAANIWTGAGGDGRWTTSANWTNGYPDTSDQIKVQGDGEIVNVVDGESINVNRMIWMDGSAFNETTTTVNFSGGTFTCSGYWMMGSFTTTATDPNQGAVFNAYGNAQINANSMSLGIGNYALVNMHISENAKVYASATTNATYRYRGFVIPGDLNKNVMARVWLRDSGELKVNNLLMGEDEDVIIDVSDNAVLYVNGNMISSEIQPLITAGKITTDGGTTTPVVNFDGEWTLVRSENNNAFAKPHTPSPSNGATVNTIVDASWLSANPEATWNLYLGTDPENLEIIDAGLTSPEYQFTDLEFGATYYWRVDELGSGTTVEGDVWQFTTRTYFQVFWFEYANQDALARILTNRWLLRFQ